MLILNKHYFVINVHGVERTLLIMFVNWKSVVYLISKKMWKWGFCALRIWILWCLAQLVETLLYFMLQLQFREKENSDNLCLKSRSYFYFYGQFWNFAELVIFKGRQTFWQIVLFFFFCSLHRQKKLVYLMQTYMDLQFRRWWT